MTQFNNLFMKTNQDPDAEIPESGKKTQVYSVTQL